VFFCGMAEIGLFIVNISLYRYIYDENHINVLFLETLLYLIKRVNIKI